MFPFRATFRPSAVALCALLAGLTGCGSDGGDEDSSIVDGGLPDPGPMSGDGSDDLAEQRVGGRRHGQVVVVEMTPLGGPVTSRAVARFVAIDTDDAAATALLERTLDTCGRRASSEADDDESPLQGDILPIDETRVLGAVDAGGAIVLTGPGGTWATLTGAPSSDIGVYGDGGASAVGIDGRVPSGLTLDIPGAEEFPGFADTAMPDPQPSADSLAPRPGSPVDVTTEYRWAANDVTGSRVRISLDTGDGRLVCFAADDGLFTLAEATMADAILPSGTTLSGAWRESTRIERTDEATLVLTVTTGMP